MNICTEYLQLSSNSAHILGTFNRALFHSLICRMLLVRYGVRPNELTVKKLGMLGCVALVLAHSVKDMKLQSSTYAGLMKLSL